MVTEYTKRYRYSGCMAIALTLNPETPFEFDDVVIRKTYELWTELFDQIFLRCGGPVFQQQMIESNNYFLSSVKKLSLQLAITKVSPYNRQYTTLYTNLNLHQ